MNARGHGAVPIPASLSSLHVIGLGLCGLDLLATVSTFPTPDTKIRTENLLPAGGGNVANTLTAVRRLGIRSTLISQVGDDSQGQQVLAELSADGVDTKLITVQHGIATPFTYVIIDRKHGTRTCIHTPAEKELETSAEHGMSLVDASILVLDGRHMNAALRLAHEANERGVPVLVDVERERVGIRELLKHADYIVTNSTYPFVYTPEAPDRIQAMRSLLEKCNARFVVCTAGSSGAILMQKESDWKGSSGGHDLFVQRRSVQGTYTMLQTFECPASPVKKVVDTTGAGDAFIGGLVYGIVTDMDTERMMCLAAKVAAEKCSGVGARSALPRREDIDVSLLAPLPKL